MRGRARLYLRPIRVRAAELDVGRVSEQMVQGGLNLVRDTRLAYANLVLAQQRAMTSTFELRSQAAEISRVWRRKLAEALAAREGRDEATESDLLTAAVGITVIQTIIEEWVLSGGSEPLVERLRRGFELVGRI